METRRIIKIINSNLKKIDQILVSDFGHGTVSKELVKKIENTSVFKSLNSQLNSSNQNQSRFDKFRKTDLLILNIGELKNEIKGKNLSVFAMAKQMRNKIKCKYIVVTLGNKGSYLINFTKNKMIYCPAFGKRVVDRVGAGDVMHSIISICLKNKIEDELSLFISSIAAAQSVENLGNSNILDKFDLIRSIKYLLK